MTNVTQSDTGRFAEERVAEVLGVPREEVRAWRKANLVEGRGFVRAGREVELTQAGLDSVMDALGLEKKEGGTVGPEALRFEPAEPVVLVVVRVPRNPRIVLAAEKKEGGAVGREVRVRVRDNRKFVPRMEIRAQATNAEGVYQLAGRGPRYRGRF